MNHNRLYAISYVFLAFGVFGVFAVFALDGPAKFIALGVQVAGLVLGLVFGRSATRAGEAEIKRVQALHRAPWEG